MSKRKYVCDWCKKDQLIIAFYVRMGKDSRCMCSECHGESKSHSHSGLRDGIRESLDLAIKLNKEEMKKDKSFKPGVIVGVHLEFD